MSPSASLQSFRTARRWSTRGWAPLRSAGRCSRATPRARPLCSSWAARRTASAPGCPRAAMRPRRSDGRWPKAWRRGVGVPSSASFVEPTTWLFASPSTPLAARSTPTALSAPTARRSARPSARSLSTSSAPQGSPAHGSRRRSARPRLHLRSSSQRTRYASRMTRDASGPRSLLPAPRQPPNPPARPPPPPLTKSPGRRCAVLSMAGWIGCAPSCA
mmetsp:Transcript_603/g.1766  ORF Transcript_603/g.1766 Transcript_603/m.1766 type:complete len:217 (+) Transcript_603:540-1190(+)